MSALTSAVRVPASRAGVRIHLLTVSPAKIVADISAGLYQYQRVLGETKKQFFLTHAALGTNGREKRKLLTSNSPLAEECGGNG